MRNKTKIISAATAAVIAFSSFGLALAEETGSDTTTRENKVQKLEERKTGIEEKRAENVRMQEALKKNIRKLMSNQIARSEKALGRLAEILRKIKARRDKMATAGVDVTQINVMITAADAKKAEADAALAKAKEKMAAIGTATDFKAAAREFMISMQDLHKKMRELHKSLTDIVKAMRDAERAAKPPPPPPPAATGGTN